MDTEIKKTWCGDMSGAIVCRDGILVKLVTGEVYEKLVNEPTSLATAILPYKPRNISASVLETTGWNKVFPKAKRAKRIN